VILEFAKNGDHTLLAHAEFCTKISIEMTKITHFIYKTHTRKLLLTKKMVKQKK